MHHIYGVDKKILIFFLPPLSISYILIFGQRKSRDILDAQTAVVVTSSLKLD